ncbi:MAG: hypothetical protein ACI84R_000904 [Candidatus Azotimanducaceae bacterium]
MARPLLSARHSRYFKNGQTNVLGSFERHHKKQNR